MVAVLHCTFLPVSLLTVTGLPSTNDTCVPPVDIIYLSVADLHVRTPILTFCMDALTQGQLRMSVTSVTEAIKHPLKHFFDSGHGETTVTMLLTTKFFVVQGCWIFRAAVPEP
ncbi:uncharacterized protein LOC142784973 [Rhipicephalus microplus]|uniref:uncharacterized protein LOC142784973 n=1 Tax=Rhipicephalus microplus TaxID=6941 RepID=UPI003F6BA5F6